MSNLDFAYSCQRRLLIMQFLWLRVIRTNFYCPVQFLHWNLIRLMKTSSYPDSSYPDFKVLQNVLGQMLPKNIIRVMQTSSYPDSTVLQILKPVIVYRTCRYHSKNFLSRDFWTVMSSKHPKFCFLLTNRRFFLLEDFT